MALERIRPIVDAHGDPYYVVERDYIGAEHANAQALWTREADAVIRRQHDEDGIHDYLPIPRATIMGWVGSRLSRIDPRSHVMGFVHKSGPDDSRPYAVDDLIEIVHVSYGTANLTLAVPLPDMNFGAIPHAGSHTVYVSISSPSEMQITRHPRGNSSQSTPGFFAFSLVW